MTEADWLERGEEFADDLKDLWAVFGELGLKKISLGQKTIPGHQKCMHGEKS